MRKTWRIGMAVVAAAVFGTAIAANARETYVDDSRLPASKCYVKTLVPAKVYVNTEGQLVRPQRQQWVVRKIGDVEQWELVTLPAVYVETRQVVEPAHYTLQRVSCDAQPAPAGPPPLSCYNTGGSRVICEPTS